MTTPNDNELLRMDGWPGGVNNRIRETEQSVSRDGEAIPSSQFLRSAVNVDLTAEGHPLRRRGYERIVSGYAHSAWWCPELQLLCAVVDGQLKAGRSIAELQSKAAVNRYLRVTYAFHGDAIYWANGKESGKLAYDGAPGVWPNPQVALDLNNREAVTPPDFEAEQGAQGQELVDDVYYAAMPVGQIVESFAGRLWVAQDEGLYFSEPIMPDVTRPATNYFMRPRYIQMVEHCHDGLYVGHDDSVWFLSGTDPLDMTARHVSPYGVVKQSPARIPGEKLGVPLDDLPVWWSNDGVLVAGLPGGEVRQLTRDRLATPEYGVGALSIREREGISQIVASLQKGGGVNTMAATDTVIAEVRRNDITVNP
jgi:hypothetical protein